MYKYFYFILFVFVLLPAYGQEDSTNNLTFEQLLKLQSESYFEQNPKSKNVVNIDKSTISEQSIRRIFKQENSVLPFEYNDRIKEIIELYLIEYPEYTSALIQNTKSDMFSDVLLQFYMPQELKLLPFVLSGANPYFDPNNDKKGVWQMDYFTAKMNGAEINSIVDERMDYVSASYAAASQIFGLYNELKDIRAAVYAFGNGIIPVRKALAEAGNSSLKLFDHLEPPYNDIYNALSALYYIDESYHRLYNANLRDIEIEKDTVAINKSICFSAISKFINLDTLILQKLNPKYYANILGDSSDVMGLIIPKSYTFDFLSKIDSIYNYCDSIKLKSPVKKENIQNKISDNDIAEIYYRVKSGDTPGFIAEWFDVGLSDLQRWNNIRRNIIRTGQTLVIYVPKHKADYYRQYNQLSYNEKQRREGYAVRNSKPKTEKLKDGEYVLYTVKKGDNPWLIAQKFPGVSDKDILKWNNISPRDLKPGQKLKIKSN